jgi:CheY-like chemotaxis protein
MPIALLVEDDPDVREIAQDILSHAGFDVVVAADGDEGLANLAGPAHIDVLVTDCEMPGRIDGLGLLDAAARLRPGMARVMVTGSLPDGFACGAPVLPKPYRAEAVVDFVLSAMAAASARPPHLGPF